MHFNETWAKNRASTMLIFDQLNDKRILAIFELANFFIVISHLLISVLLSYLYYKCRRDFRYSWVLLIFILFITLCGLSHLIWLWFWLYLSFLVACAILSVFAAMMLPLAIRYVMTLSKPQAFQIMIDSLMKMNHEKEIELERRKVMKSALEEKNGRLAAKIQQLEDQLNQKAWMFERRQDIEIMRNQLEDLKKIQLEPIPFEEEK